MLKIFAPADRDRPFCDGVSRRNFLKIGGLGAVGLSLPNLLALEAQAGIRNSPKSVILIYLVGGPPHPSSRTRRARSPARTSRSGPMCRALKSANSSRAWPG
jgi:TAT (twin-arginine translocation) pathway signal sequence